jgi:hypothetical protein
MYLTITDNVDKFKGLLSKILNRKKTKKEKTIITKRDIEPSY